MRVAACAINLKRIVAILLWRRRFYVCVVVVAVVVFGISVSVVVVAAAASIAIGINRTIAAVSQMIVL